MQLSDSHFVYGRKIEQIFMRV